MVSSTLLLTLIEAIRHAKVPSYIELICLALGFVGAVIMAAPELIEKLFLFVFCCNTKSDKIKAESSKSQQKSHQNDGTSEELTQFDKSKS